ncbi:MAG TPA: hypothetical protein VLB47_03985, partial [Solirubrobacteraceae bacterium]|nr:hypothetical protein [Solirubrobacteraceae bacterium]
MVQRSLTRREVLRDAAGGAAALALASRLELPGLATAPAAAAAGTPVGGWREVDYWGFADPIAAWMDRHWDAADGSYRVSRSGETVINAAMLTIHAVAALRGHRGASRHDERARRLARRLCASPPWSERTRPSWPDKMFHRHGWVADLQHLDSAGMEKSVDPKVAEGLATAYRARDVIGLDAGDVAVMRDRVRRCAYDPFFRYPYVRLNQINWNSEMFAHLATMTGDTALLRRDYYLHIRRFCAGVRTPWVHGNAPNLQAGYRFGYLTTRPPSNRYNLDSAEYANITVHFLLWYERARRAGMPPLPKADKDLLKAWVERIVMGYWTHSGFLNWDSGLGLGRWQIGKTFAFAQQGLLALALATSFHTRREFGGWAKFFLDRGFGLYRQWAVDERDVLAPAWLNGIHSFRGGAESDRILFAVRTAANAVRAVDLGIARRDAIEPPPIYAYDPDIGRVAVSTPAYSTAVLAVNQGAVRYGGAELARLYDADGRPI